MQIALDLGDAKLYWTVLSEVWRSNVDGTSPVLIHRVAASSVSGIAIDSAQGSLYVLSPVGFNSRIERTNLDGTGVQEILIGPGWSFGALAVGDGKLFWASLDMLTAMSNLYRVDVDGTNFVDSGAGGSDNRIRRSNLDGSGIEDLAFLG